MNRQRPPTLQDVADRAGVSRALVSIVIRNVPGASAETRARVQQVAAELRYRPDHRARLLAGQRTRLLGVTLALSNPFHADLVEEIYSAADALDYQVVLSAVTTKRSARQAIDTLLDYRCEAALLIGPLPAPSVLTGLASERPVVVVGQPTRASGVDVVRASGERGLQLAVDHLVQLGHRRIWHLDGGRAPGAAERRRGYRAAMHAAGLTAETRIVPAGASETDGAAAGRRLAQELLPDAVVTYNDRCAVGLLDQLARLDIPVPQRLSVVGYDDSQVARLPYLRITTISQDAAGLARRSVGQVVARLDGEDQPTELVVSPRLIVRDTTGRGPNS